jgi:phospholipid transport system substrate-binding protein
MASTWRTIPLSTSNDSFAIRRRSLLVTLAVLPLALSAAPAGARDPEAEGFIRGIGDDVMAILQQADKSDQEKLVSLKELLDANTDLELIARLVLGRHWGAASEEQRQEYVGLFQQILMNTIAERLGDYNGQTFEVVGSSELNERDTAVQSRILRVGGAPPLRVDWRVRDTEGDFAIIDVIAEGVSLVVSQRNEVGSVVERRGMAGLIEVMRERSTDGEAVL